MLYAVRATALTIAMIAGAASTADARAHRVYREVIQTSHDQHSVAVPHHDNITVYEATAPRARRSRYRHHRVVRPAVPRSGMVSAMCGPKPIMRGVASTMAGRFTSFCRELAGTGYKIEFVGGWRPGSCSFGSRHPCGGAIDINQTARNRVTQRFPAGINAMARRPGLLHGAEWNHAAAGLFERLDRYSLAKIDGKGLPMPWPVAALPSRRPEPEIEPAAPPRPMALASADQGDSAFWEAPEQPQDRVPEPIGPQDAANIFRRYQVSREVVIQPHVRFSCPGGQPMPAGIQSLVMDASLHFGRSVVVNSAYRDKKYNRKVGGARHSQHIQCKAIDFRVEGVVAGVLRGWVMANRLRWRVGGIGLYGTYIHADQRPQLVTWTGGVRKVRHARRHHNRHRRYAAAI